MTLRKKARNKFVKHLGKQFRDDKTLLQVYSRDMAELPSTTKLLIRNIPDGIILPRNIKDIQQAYKVANETKVPLIPRSAGTSGFGGSIPYKKGVILDGKGLESDIIVEPFDQSVLVSPSMVFSELQRYLKMQGVSLCVFPSSYYSATLGGFIAHGGYGVGSAQYGGAIDQILAIEVVLPNVELVNYTEREDIELIVGSNGTLGLITKVQLKIKFDIPLKHRGCTFDSPKELEDGLKVLASINPYSIWILNPKHVAEMNDAFGFTLPNRYVVLISKEVSFEEEESDFHASFNQAIRDGGGQILDKRYTDKIWDIRYKTFTMIKDYQDFLVSELILPIEKSGKYLQKLASEFNGQLHFEGEVINNSHFSLLLFLYFDEKLTPLKKTIINLKLYKTVMKGKKVGGFPYSTGLWFSGYYSKIFGKEQYKRYKELKKKVDPKNISNPGKVISPRVRIFPLITFKFALKIASWLIR